MADAGEQAVPGGPGAVAGAALVLGAASLWATFGLFAKHLYAAGYSPLELASVRAFVGFACIALFALARRRRAALRISRGAILFFALYGIVGLALFQYAYFAALDRTTVAVAVALLYTAPAFVVLGSALLWKERLGRARRVALALVVCGVVLVTGALESLLRGTAPVSWGALLFGLLSGLTYGLYSMFSKTASGRFGTTAALFWSFLFATAALAVLASPLPPLLHAGGDLPLLVGLGIVPTVAPYALYLLALRGLPASTAAMLASAEPAIATLLAAAVLGEQFGVLQGVGVGLIMGAAVLLTQR